MKTVFSSSELPHIWAAQKQDHGRAQANVFFEGPKIYSYGHHLPTSLTLAQPEVYEV